jgi:hypothetical protein
MTRIKLKDKNQSTAASAPLTNARPLSFGAIEVNRPVKLAKATGTKKTTPGRKYNGTASFLTKDNAEYLYLTNSYISRGLDTEAEAIVRNGYSISPNKTSDQKMIDDILKTNNLDLLIRDIDVYIGLYGQPMMERFIDKETNIWKFELLPPTEMDYLRDKSNNVLYDKTTGRPQGYVQKRDGKEIATWSGDDAKRITVFKNRTLGGYIEGIPGIQSILYSATEYGFIRASISDSFIRSLPVCQIIAEGASPEDISEVMAAVGTKFTSRTFYVTSERFQMNNTAPSNDIDVFKFIEPTLSEIAACFHMPIEMLAATQYLKSDDFNDRYTEWLEHIKMRQRLIASIFEREVFNQIFPDGVTFKFNSPATVDKTELITSVGFATQSNAITPQMALDILVKNQVFGPFTNDILQTKSTGDPNGVQEQKEEKVTDAEDGQ